MGNIKKLLSIGELDPRILTATTVWTDLCENIHLHYRNVRVDFSEKEFAHFRAAINMCGKALEKSAVENNYKEGNPNFLIQQIFNTPVDSSSEYFPNRVCIEINTDDTIHLHYRDIRLHLTLNEFSKLSAMFSEASKTLSELKPSKYLGQTFRSLENIPIHDIMPYDEGHKPGVIDKYHRQGIDIVKQLILKETKIRPILVNTWLKRMDGFKRYIAHVELQQPFIECYVDPWAKPGGQHNQSFEADDAFI